jgi:hypothetical protein
VRDAQLIVEGACVIVAGRHGVRFDPVRPPAIDQAALQARIDSFDQAARDREAEVVRVAEQRMELAHERGVTSKERDVAIQRIRDKQAAHLATKRPGRRKTN